MRTPLAGTPAAVRARRQLLARGPSAKCLDVGDGHLQQGRRRSTQLSTHSGLACDVVLHTQPPMPVIGQPQLCAKRAVRHASHIAASEEQGVQASPSIHQRAGNAPPPPLQAQWKWM
jgi:hypothetical protein